MFAEVKELDFVAMERQVLLLWEECGTFDKLRQKNAGNEPFSFIDGPITANNPRGIGVHHAWGRTYKDVFQRYKAMLGYDQRFQNGFDCQGLWVEVEVEKELGFNGKRDILEYGLDRFAQQCRQRVDLSVQAMVRTSHRLGQWMDWEDSYYTYSDDNIEHIWHFLKKCHEKGWLYKGHRVMPWCTRCGTSLSQHELTDAYRDVEHRAVFVQLPLVGRPGEYVVVWTTTPWTLVANAALALHPELDYAGVERDGEVFYMAREAAERLGGSGKVVEVLKGQDLVGWHYGGPFDELPVQVKVERRIVSWEEVGGDEGSGVVHIAPGCGAEDYELGQEYDLAVLAPLDEDGVYVDGYGEFSGAQVADVGRRVVEVLREKGMLYAEQDYEHRYPHCWRCGTELVFRLVDEWFIACNEVRGQMLEAVQQVQWVPDHAGKRMEDWLRNMGDWCISRKRYWGLPLPFYESEDGELVVVGSRAELRELAVDPEAVDGLQELHRPWIDAVEVQTPQGKTARRVVEVGDCWLDAGIVPFSTLEYLSGDQTQWDKWFPADFVVEMREQIRLWFYSMLFMSVTLEQRAPYRTVMAFENMHDERGEPMHKSKGNALWFDEVVEEIGAEPMRWLFAGQNLALNLQFGRQGAAAVKRRFLTLWNTYRFYVQYANLDGMDPHRARRQAELSEIDRWLLACLQELVGEVRQALEMWDLPPVVRAAEHFFDELSNWYVRLNRRRFWKSASDGDKAAAHWVLYETLTTLCRLLAPVLPFLSEAMYQNLVCAVDEEAPNSVHLCVFPDVEEEWHNAQLLDDMAVVQRVVAVGRALREQARLKVRQPLQRLLVVAPEAMNAALMRLEALVRRELNVKVVELVEDRVVLLELELKPNFRTLGRKYGHLVPQIQAALEKLDAAETAALLEDAATVRLQVGEEEVELDAEDVEVVTRPRDGLVTFAEGDLCVALDVRLTQELVEEGVVREFVHYVQGRRKDMGLDMIDRIRLRYRATENVGRVLEQHGEYIGSETLCVEMERSEVLQAETHLLNGEEVAVVLERVE